MKIPYILAVSALLAAMTASAVPTLTVDYAKLDYDNLAVDPPNCSAKLTWTAGMAVDIQRRKGNEATWTTIAEGDDSGEYIDNDPAVIPSVTYHYRLADGGGAGTEVDFLAVRHLPTAGYPLFSDGDFTSQSWCKPASRAFDGSTARDSYPDAASPQRPKIGIDFGSATNYLAFARLVPRYTDGCENRLHHTIIYGTADSEVDGTALTDEADVANVDSGSGKQWYTVNTFSSSTAYRCYYFKGATGANVNECAFFGWTADDLDAATAIDLACSVARSDWENSYAIVTWDSAAGTVTVQRKVGDEGVWNDLAESSAGTYTDQTMPYGQTIHYRIAKDGGTSPSVSFLRMRRLHTEGYPLFDNGNHTVDWYKPVENAFDGNVNTFPDMTFSTDARMGVDFGAATNFVAFARLISRNDTVYRLGGFRVCGSGGNWESEGTTLTDVIAYQDGVVLYELDADYSTAYRCYYAYDNDNQSYGNIAEIEFYGWSADDIGLVVDLFDLSITRSDLVDYYPVLSWNGGLSQNVSVQRRSGDHAWTTVTTAYPGTTLHTDTTAKCGIPYEYRLVSGNDVSATVPFRRLRKLDVAGYTLFSQGTPYKGSDKDHAKAFDGNLGTYPDLVNYTNPKVGVDFGAATNVVVMARFYPRADLLYRMAGIRLYGSDDDAAAEVESAESATQLTTAITGDIANRWYEVPVNGEPTAYRTYYVRDMYECANVAEVELYGWWTTDIPEPCTVILFR